MNESKANKQPRNRILFGKLILAAISAAITLLMCEGIVRVVAPQPKDWVRVYANHPELPVFGLRPGAHQTIPSADGGEWSIFISDKGERAPETPLQLGAVLPEMWCFGDSFTFGNGVNFEDTYVGKLEDEQALGFNYRNTAVPGYGPNEYLMLFQHLLDESEQPERIVVFSYLGNDFFDCIWNKNIPVYDGILGTKPSTKRWLKRNVHLFRLCAGALRRFRTRGAPDVLYQQMQEAATWTDGPLKGAQEVYMSAFADIHSICEERGIKMCAVLIPDREEVRRLCDGTQADDVSVARRYALATLGELEIPYKDLTDSLVEATLAKTYLKFNGHFTVLGNQIAHDEVISLIESLE